jgi:sugar phosphate permease
VQNFTGLVTTRIFLRFFEGHLFPAMTLLLCNWYTREELGIRIAYILTLANISGVVSGQIYKSSAAPKYTLGHAWSLGCLEFTLCGWWIVKVMYKKREAGKDRKLAERYSMPAGRMYTDREPDFRYQIYHQM